ncbi:MobQ family relaxase [Stutzerimonas zhaodongensis]|uniref:MobQ family relaxase n=1 Tax=Stutzerimonas zhaodongensis TaxID=1176257 RepID=UPI0021068619|nr:MobA/MobL family protein [Stutzerimonas zhaodongensis]
MSIYSASLKTVSRSAGRSATAAAAYRLGEVIEDERTGECHDYTRRGGVEGTFAFAPAGTAPLPANKLWNAAEAAETRKNSTVARELLIALPHDLDPVQRESLTRAIAAQVADRYGVAGSVGIHVPDAEGDQRNYHAHILFTTRSVDQDGKLGAKTRVLDDKKTGPAETIWIRKMVEQETNAALEAAGVESRVDCRSLRDQRAAALEMGNLELAQELDRAPQTHEGPKVTDIRREAVRESREPLGALDRAAANDSQHFDIDAGRVELAEVISMIEHLEKRGAERTAAHVEAIKEDRLRDRLTAARAELKLTESQRIDLAIKLDQGEPGFVQEARDMRKDMVKAKAAAQVFRDENVWFSKFADVVGIKLETDRAAEYATAKFVKSPKRRMAKEWSSEHKEDNATYKKLAKDEAACEAKVSRLDAQVSALNRPDPELAEQIKTEVAQAVEHAQPEIASFVENHRTEIAAAADMGGVDAWMSSEIIETGNPIIDQLSRKSAQFRQRMMREEIQRAEQNEMIAAQAVGKLQASLRKTLDAAFRSAARDVEPRRYDHAALSRKLAAEAAELKAKKTAGEYVPTWKRVANDDDSPTIRR